MKVRVTLRSPEYSLEEDFTGKDATEVVRAVQRRAACDQGFVVRIAINAMSPLQFAREVVTHFNKATNQQLPIPNSCEEFLNTGVALGIATVLDEQPDSAPS